MGLRLESAARWSSWLRGYALGGLAVGEAPALLFMPPRLTRGAAGG